MRLIVTSFLGNCSSCTGICYLGNHLNCNRIGCLGNLPSCTVERDFCHRSVVLDHDYHVTIQVYPDWILDDQGNHTWNHSAEGTSSTERAARSWREYWDEKDPLCENWQEKRGNVVIKNATLKTEQLIQLPSDAILEIFRLHKDKSRLLGSCTRSRNYQTTTSSPELAFHEDVLLARHAILPNAWRTAKFVCVGGYNRVACWKLQRLDSGMQCEVREREKKEKVRLFFFPAHTFSASFTQSDRLEQVIRPRAFPFLREKPWGRDYTQTWGPGLCLTSTYSLSLFLSEKRIYLSHACHKISRINKTQSPHQVTQQNTNWVI